MNTSTVDLLAFPSFWLCSAHTAIVMAHEAVVVRPPPQQYYHIRNKQTGCVLEIKSACSKPHTYIVVNQKSASPEGESHQLWYLEEAEDGFVYIVSKLNGLVLDIEGCSSSQGSYLITWHRKPPPENVANQKWKFEKDAIVSQMTGQVIEVAVQGVSKSPEAYIVMGKRRQPLADNQHWSFMPLGTYRHNGDPDDCPGGQSIPTVTSDDNAP